jgi:Spy/CpxP family protein refolding chaperone
MNGENGGRARRMRLLAVLSLLVVFVAGALVGAAVEHGRHDGPRERRGPRVERRGGPPPIFAEGSPLAQRLKLTAAQRDSIERITERDRVRADSVFRETRRGMRTHFDSTMRAVEAVLTPEQRTEWQRIRQEWEARDRREGREGRGRRGRGGPDHPGMPPPE